MKALILCGLVMFSFTAQAHFELGPYEGQTKSGQKCKINFLKKEYRFDTKNPLNEIVTVELASGEIFELEHSLVFDRETATVSFDHDHLTGAKGTRNGAIVLQVTMIHTEAKEGPNNFLLVDHNWRNGDKEIHECFDLQHIDK